MANKYIYPFRNAKGLDESVPFHFSHRIFLQINIRRLKALYLWSLLGILISLKEKTNLKNKNPWVSAGFVFSGSLTAAKCTHSPLLSPALQVREASPE